MKDFIELNLWKIITVSALQFKIVVAFRHRKINKVS